MNNCKDCKYCDDVLEMDDERLLKQLKKNREDLNHVIEMLELRIKKEQNKEKEIETDIEDFDIVKELNKRIGFGYYPYYHRPYTTSVYPRQYYRIY